MIARIMALIMMGLAAVEVVGADDKTLHHEWFYVAGLFAGGLLLYIASGLRYKNDDWL